MPSRGDDVFFAGNPPANNADVIMLGGATRSMRRLVIEANPGISTIRDGTLNIVGPGDGTIAFDQRMPSGLLSVEVPVTLGEQGVSGGTSTVQMHVTEPFVSSYGLFFQGGVTKADVGQRVDLQLFGPGGARFLLGPSTPIGHDDTIVSGGYLHADVKAGGPSAFGSGTIHFQQGGTVEISTSQAGDFGLSNAIDVGAAGGLLRLNNPTTVSIGRMTGPIALGGGLDFLTATSLSDVAGPVTIVSDTASLSQSSLFGSFATRISGNIAEDVSGRRLALRTSAVRQGDLIIAGAVNTWSGGTVVEAIPGFAAAGALGFVDVAAGSTLGTGGVVVKPTGKLRLRSPGNVVGSGNVLVEGGGLVQVSDMGFETGLGEVSVDSRGGLALEGEPVGLDLSASGHRFLYVAAGKNVAITTGWTPSQDTYRIGGGRAAGGTLTIGASNILTGAARSLLHGGDGNDGQSRISRPQDFGGGTTVAGGTLTVTAAGALGSGAVTVTGGTLVAGGPGVLDPARVLVSGGTLSLSDPDAVNVGTSTVRLAGGTLELNMGSATGAMVFHANARLSGNATIRLSSTASDSRGSLGDLALSGGRVTFEQTASYSSTLAVSGDVTFSRGSSFDLGTSFTTTAVVVDGRVVSADGAPFVKSGTGLLKLLNHQNQMGGVTINGGAVMIDAAAALGGATGPLTLAGGKLVVAAQEPTLIENPLKLGSGGTIEASGGGLVTVRANVGPAGVLTYRGFTLSGVGNGVLNASLADFGAPTSLTKTGSGTWTLGAASTHTGATSVQAGRLVITHPAALGAGALAVEANGLVDVRAPVIRAGGLSGGGVVTTTLPEAVTLELSGGGIFDTTIDDGAGRLGLTKVGSQGVLTLYRTQPYSGVTAVRGGSVNLSRGATLPNTSALVIGGGRLEAVSYDSAIPSWFNTTHPVPLTLGDRAYGGGTFVPGGRTGATIIQPFGPLALEPGGNVITLPYPGSASPTVGVTFAGVAGGPSLIRSAGATFRVSGAGQAAKGGGVKFLSPPPLVNGILGGWAVTELSGGSVDWATLDAGGGVTAYSGVKQSENPNDVSAAGWVPQNNVLYAYYGAKPIMSDSRTVNTLVLTTHLDLGGNVLTLAAGGLRFETYYLGSLANGTVSIGPDAADLNIFAQSALPMYARVDLGDRPLVVAGKVELRNADNRLGALYVVGDTSFTNSRVESHAQGAIGRVGPVHLFGGELRIATADQIYPELPIVVGGQGGAIYATGVRAEFGGPVALNGDLAIDRNSYDANSTVILSGPISGSGTVSFNPGTNAGDTSRLELMGANTFTGGVTAGATYRGVASLVVGHDTALGTGVLTVDHVLTLEGRNGPRSLPNPVKLLDNLSTGGDERIELAGTVTIVGDRSIWTAAAAPLAVSGGIFETYFPASLTKDGPGVLTIAGVTSHTGPTTVSMGRLRVAGSIAMSAGVTVKAGAVFEAAATQQLKRLTVEGGGSAIVNAGRGSVLTVNDLALGVTAVLDVGQGAVIIEQASTTPLQLSTLRQYIILGRGTGRWDGRAGISSSAAADDPGLAVGFARSASLLGDRGGDFLGQSVSGSALLVRATLAGDATLDGAVDFNDLVRLAQNYNTTVSATTDDWWYSGDFTYDGVVDFNDLVVLAQNYNGVLGQGAEIIQLPEFQADLATALASVPEPSLTGSLIAVTMVGQLARRRSTLQRPRRAVGTITGPRKGKRCDPCCAC